MTSPSSAAKIWFHQGSVRLELPSTVANGHGHSLTFTDDLIGWARIKTILREREHTAPSLAKRGTPTQSQLPEYDKAKVRRVGRPRPKVSPAVAQSAREVMRKLGLL